MTRSRLRDLLARFFCALLPLRLLPRAPTSCTQLGDPELQWAGRLYLDGGGFAMDTPEIARCSWAVVQLSADGRPCKAIFGTLPGVQTVARAERYAGLVATCLSPLVTDLISDHLSFVQEGQWWSPADASATARHAALWRSLRATVARQCREPPRFGWIPSRKSLDQALELGLGLQD